VAIALAQKHHFSVLQTARLLAQMNMAMSDAIIGCWDAKYMFAFWRPITAIRSADSDGNPDTQADPTWTPLLVTPPFPGYPSAHSCASGAAVRVLSHYFGENTAISVTNDALPGQCALSRAFQPPSTKSLTLACSVAFISEQIAMPDRRSAVLSANTLSNTQCAGLMGLTCVIERRRDLAY